MRVGDSFIADENRFAQAAIYATDNDVLVIQEALGTLNHTELGRRAIEYAYDHGVTVIASAADEAAQHHNWPSSNPHVIQVNSVTQYDETFTAVPRSYLQFNGCTNFSAKITLAIPSVSCSSDATGRGIGDGGNRLQRRARGDRRRRPGGAPHLPPDQRRPLPAERQRGAPADGVRRRRRHADGGRRELRHHRAVVLAGAGRPAAPTRTSTRAPSPPGPVAPLPGARSGTRPARGSTSSTATGA